MLLNTYKSIVDANRALGLKKSHITEACKGKIKTANGFIWKYAKSKE